MHFLRSLVLLAASTALFGAVGTDNTFHWSGRVPPGQLIEVRGVNGSIHAEPAVGQEVDVVAYKNGQQLDAGDIKVRVVEHDGGVTICAVYPSPNNDVSVDFTVRVPKGVRFLARTVNGLVEANSLDAYTEAHSVNGNLRLSTAGTAQGETVNGSIIASVGRITEPLKFSTVNGGITLEMPRGTGAEVHANTIHGRIATDFPIGMHGRLMGRHVDGAIGRGGPQLRLATVNGSITLRKRF
ncbi:MAG TPA: hypothetical protein VIX89_11320 [Bryobacteraceae bacterium]